METLKQLQQRFSIGNDTVTVRQDLTTGQDNFCLITRHADGRIDPVRVFSRLSTASTDDNV